MPHTETPIRTAFAAQNASFRVDRFRASWLRQKKKTDHKGDSVIWFALCPMAADSLARQHFALAGV